MRGQEVIYAVRRQPLCDKSGGSTVGAVQDYRFMVCGKAQHESGNGAEFKAADFSQYINSIRVIRLIEA